YFVPKLAQKISRSSAFTHREIGTVKIRSHERFMIVAVVERPIQWEEHASPAQSRRISCAATLERCGARPFQADMKNDSRSHRGDVVQKPRLVSGKPGEPNT